MPSDGFLADNSHNRKDEAGERSDDASDSLT